MTAPAVAARGGIRGPFGKETTMLSTRNTGVRAFVAGFAVACGTALTGTTAEAAQIFTDRAAWEAALSGATIVNETFPDTIDNAPVITFASGVVSTGVDGLASNHVTGNALGGTYGANIDSNPSPFSETLFDSITWTFPTPVVAFGADWSNFGAGGITLLASGDFDGTGTSTIDFVNVLGDDVFNQHDFLGVIGDAAFANVVFTNSDHPTILNVAFSARFLSFTTGAVRVPQPATLLLLLAAFAVLSVAASRRVAWRHVG
jgi:hypothetical protein